jgi:serine protease Do
MHRSPRYAAIPGFRARLVPVMILFSLAGFSRAQAGQEAQTPSPRQAACQESIPDLFNRVSPSVVSISAMSINPWAMEDRTDRVEGSGVIIEPSGLVLTNSHVVFGRHVITVTLDDGTTLPARMVGADPLFDVALLRIPKPDRGVLPVAQLGDSGRLLVGEEVYAIGNPFGLEQTLTRGIVSAINRLLPGAAWSLTEPLIQTDAAINPGNSGGPLVDRCGDVIGITTALLPEAQSIGFAVPVNLIKEVMSSLIEKGRIVRPWLGVQGQLVGKDLKELLRVPMIDGFLVEIVEPGSPAEQAGVQGGGLDLVISGEPVLLGGDIITAVNGTGVSDPEKMSQVLGSLKVGQTVHLALFRQSKTRELDIVLVERPLLPGDIPARRGSTPAEGVRPGLAHRFRSVRRAF